ncbi:unannotated protein [freshwater metagenome]|uniref:Unannotated protein n=1 Tax=freshwater metagenome TaxID=449393 RepID=A0A6J7H0H9_9ZZZZ|nr:DUF2294 family protein [Actinomycetota bacterium]
MSDSDSGSAARDLPGDRDADGASVDRALTDAVVRTLRALTGRGATSARGFINGDTAVVVMYDALTEGERNLVRKGHADQVKELRYTYQRAMADEVVPAVEQAVGRRVEAFMSANHVDPDHAVEVFILGDPL